MRLNKMNEIPVGTKMFDVFGGYNRTTECAINEGAEMLNMSSEKYPAMAPRTPRGELARSNMVNTLTSIIANDALYSVETLPDGQATISRYTEDGWKAVQLVAKNALAQELISSFAWTLKKNYGERYFLKMGAYIVVFPDKLMFNTQEMTQTESGNFKVDVYALEHERNSTSVAGGYKNGYVVSLTKLGKEEQNAASVSGFSGRMASAAYERKPDAPTAQDAGYIFNTMMNGDTRTSGFKFAIDSYSVTTEKETGLQVYSPLADKEILDLDGLLYCDYAANPPTLWELTKVTSGGSHVYKWQKVNNPLVKILCNSAVKNPGFSNNDSPPGATSDPLAGQNPGQYYDRQVVGTDSYTYNRATNGIGVELSVGDYVTISRSIYKYEDGVRQLHQEDNHGNFGKEYRVEAVGDDYIVIDAELDSLMWAMAGDVEFAGHTWHIGELEITRKVPEMDFVCEYNNRLYGCSSANHEIYASKLGDPKSWYCYQGISTDSYAATVGTDGDFTGCTAYGGNVYFFKEDVIHRLYGNAPSNFQLTSYDVPGVAKGSHKSLREVGGVLYYLSPVGVMAYDGNYPVSIHSVFDGQRFKNGVAGRWQNKYYLSVQDEANAHQLLVYDSTRRLWHREDDLPVKVFEEYENHLLAAVSDKVLSLTGGFTPHEDKVQWRFISGTTGSESFNHEHISKMMLRIMADTGTRIKVYLQYDGGEWLQAFSTTATANKPFTIKTIPRRCDTMRYRVDGIGNGKILSACIYTEEGSELNV